MALGVDLLRIDHFDFFPVSSLSASTVTVYCGSAAWGLPDADGLGRLELDSVARFLFEDFSEDFDDFVKRFRLCDREASRCDSSSSLSLALRPLKSSSSLVRETSVCERFDGAKFGRVESKLVIEV